MTLTTSSTIRVRKTDDNAHRIDIISPQSNWEQWVLLSSDHHFDNPHADVKLIKKHLDQAKERNALVFMFGDFFCAMQGRRDPRHNKSDLKSEHKSIDYLDTIVESGIDLLADYKDQIVLIGYGNHETAILKNNETDLVSRLVSGLNQRHDAKIQKGSYGGYVQFSFGTPGGGNKNNIKMYYSHGYGGGGEVSKGIIQSQRRAVYVSDADIVVSGHVHDAVVSDWGKVRMNRSGKVEQYFQKHIILPSYKDEYDKGQGGFHIEKGRPPKPIGAMWLRFFYENQRIKFETIDAR